MAQFARSSLSIIGIISAGICFIALLLYYFLLPSSRRNALNKVCCYVTFGDLITSLGLIFGFTNDRTYLCQTQAFLTNVGPLWSIFWTIRIAVIVMKIVSRDPNRVRTFPVTSATAAATSTPCSNMSTTSGRFSFSTFSAKLKPSPTTSSTNRQENDLELSSFWQFSCWFWPLVLTLLILTTNRYGCGVDDDLCWCFIGNRPDSPNWTQAFWTISAFYFWVWSSILVFIIVSIFALYRCHQFQKSLSKSSIEGMIVRTLLPYPIIIIICWIYPTIYDIVIAIDPQSPLVTHHQSVLIASILPTLQGMITGIIFIRLIIKECRSSYAVLPDTTIGSESRQVACVHNLNINEMISSNG